VCGIGVTNASTSYCDSDGCTPDVFFAEKPGELVGQGGDSGTPVYTRPNSTRATIKDIEIAGTAPDNLFGEKVSQVQSHLEVTVATS
jgi:ABC-type phosphonate transport system ATPase subunit